MLLEVYGSRRYWFCCMLFAIENFCIGPTLRCLRQSIISPWPSFPAALCPVILHVTATDLLEVIFCTFLSKWPRQVSLFWNDDAYIIDMTLFLAQLAFHGILLAVDAVLENDFMPSYLPYFAITLSYTPAMCSCHPIIDKPCHVPFCCK